MSEKKAGNWKSGLKWFLLNVIVAIIAMEIIRSALIELDLLQTQRPFFQKLQHIFTMIWLSAILIFLVLSLLRIFSKKLRKKLKRSWFISLQAIVLLFAIVVTVSREPTPSEKAAYEIERAENEAAWRAEKAARREEDKRLRAHNRVSRALDQHYGKGFLVTKAEFSDSWPFKNAEIATIRCSPSISETKIVTIQFDEDQRVYALTRPAGSIKSLPEPAAYFDLKSGETYENVIPSKWITDGEAICRDRQQKNTELAKKNFSKCVSEWDGSVFQVIELVKRQMNDPKSFEHVSTSTRLIEGTTGSVIMRFRGKNALGATVLQTVMAHVEPKSCNVMSVRWP